MNDLVTTIETYNRGAQFYRDKFAAIGARRDDILRARSFVNKPCPNILELGCGNGRDAEVILEDLCSYLGMDASEAMIALAQELLPKASFEVADMRMVELPKDLDIIFAFASLLHLDRNECRSILEKSHQSLAPDGIVYISVKCDTYQIREKHDTFGTRIFYYYTLEDFEEFSHGLFSIIYIDHQEKLGVPWLTIALRKSEVL
jgi:SAM-dependent methyltransferase